MMAYGFVTIDQVTCRARLANHWPNTEANEPARQLLMTRTLQRIAHTPREPEPWQFCARHFGAAQPTFNAHKQSAAADFMYHKMAAVRGAAAFISCNNESNAT